MGGGGDRAVEEGCCDCFGVVGRGNGFGSGECVSVLTFRC